MNADARFTTHAVLLEVFGERVRQDAKWGQQDHPCVTIEMPDGYPVRIDERAAFYGIPSEQDAKATCEARFGGGFGTYADIAIEEVAEAVGAEDDAKRRAELVQCAAVFVAWIEAIDRRAARALDSVSMDPPPVLLPAFAGVDVAEARFEVDVPEWSDPGLRRLEADLAVTA